MMNCLEYALLFWLKHRDYTILYDSDHVINVPIGTEVPGVLPLTDFGKQHIIDSFKMQSKLFQNIIEMFFHG